MSDTPQNKSGLTGVINGIDNGIAALERVIMATGVILMAINTIANVISRFIFNHSIIFAEELNSIFILLVTFAGIGYAARHGRHIRMSAISDAMPERVRKLLMIVITAITAALMFLLAWYAVQYIINLHAKGRVYPALGIPSLYQLSLGTDRPARDRNSIRTDLHQKPARNRKSTCPLICEKPILRNWNWSCSRWRF